MKGSAKQKHSRPHHHQLSFSNRRKSLDMTKHQNIRKYLTPKYYLSNEQKEVSCHLNSQPKEEFHSISPLMIINNSLLLPPLLSSQPQSTKTLVLDLDETLIHSSFDRFSFEADLTIQVDLENQAKDLFVLKRPNLDDFLIRVSKCYEIVIFTASLSKYANRLIDIIDKEKVCKYRLFREECTLINNVYVKELKKLNRNLKNVVILDNNPNSFSLDKDNGIPIKSFIEDKSDNELIQMAYILEKIGKADDVRVLIRAIVHMNKIDYDKAFELLKNKDDDHDDKLIEQFSKALVNKGKATANDLLSTQGKVKIIRVEKVDSNSKSSQCNPNKNFSKTIKPTTVLHANPFRGNIINEKSSFSTSLFYSSKKKSNQSYNNELTGKSFQSIGNKSKSKDVFCTLQNIDRRGNQFSTYKHNNGNKSDKVKLLPNAKPEDNKAKNVDDDDYYHASYNSNLIELSKELNVTDVDQSSKRSSSVIPSKPNSLKHRKESNHQMKSVSNKRTGLKTQHQSEHYYNTSNLQKTLPKGEPGNKNIFQPKNHQSSRASLNNMQTTIPHPISNRTQKREETQAINNNQFINAKKKKMALKFTNSQPKKIKPNNDCKILKIISNKTISALNRSKTSSKKINHHNDYNNHTTGQKLLK